MRLPFITLRSYSQQLSQFSLEPFKDKLNKCISKMNSEFSTLRLGKANPSLLNKVLVEDKGRFVRLNEISNIHIKDPRTLHVIMHDKCLIDLAEKAIRNAGLNLNPLRAQESKDILKVPIPKLSMESRKLLVKQITSLSETAKSSVRNHRQDCRNFLKKAKLAKDDDRRIQNEIQELTDSSNKKIEDLVKIKIKEIEVA
jgi:ribosome recycling factor